MAEEPKLEAIIDAVDEAIFEGDYDEAARALREAEQEYGEQEALAALRVELLLERGDYAECVEEAERLAAGLEGAQVRAQVLAFKAWALYYADETERARRAFNAAVQADPGAWSAVVGRATVHDFMGFSRAAYIDLDRAIALDDQEAQAFTMRGALLLRFGQAAKAKEDFAYALECDPWDEEARLFLARLQALDGESAAARGTLEQLVDEGEQPEFVVPGALLRSQLSLGLGSTEAAIEDADKAAALMPDEPWGFLQRAAAQITAAEPGEAIASLKEAEARMADPRDYPDLHALRASAYEQLGKPEQAAEAHEMAEGASRLPGVVYGESLDPARNVPVNPNKPVDVRQVLGQIFGDPDAAPPGYADAVREVIAKIPSFMQENPDAGRLEIELPAIEGMGSPGNLIIEVKQPSQ